MADQHHYQTNGRLHLLKNSETIKGISGFKVGGADEKVEQRHVLPVAASKDIFLEGEKPGRDERKNVIYHHEINMLHFINIYLFL